VNEKKKGTAEKLGATACREPSGGKKTPKKIAGAGRGKGYQKGRGRRQKSSKKTKKKEERKGDVNDPRGGASKTAQTLYGVKKMIVSRPAKGRGKGNTGL